MLEEQILTHECTIVEITPEEPQVTYSEPKQEEKPLETVSYSLCLWDKDGVRITYDGCTNVGRHGPELYFTFQNVNDNNIRIIYDTFVVNDFPMEPFWVESISVDDITIGALSWHDKLDILKTSGLRNVLISFIGYDENNNIIFETPVTKLEF